MGGNKFVRIFLLDDILHEKIKSNVTYLTRIKLLWKNQLKVWKLLTTINIWAVATIIKWKENEMEGIEKNTWKLMVETENSTSTNKCDEILQTTEGEGWLVFKTVLPTSTDLQYQIKFFSSCFGLTDKSDIYICFFFKEILSTNIAEYCWIIRKQRRKFIQEMPDQKLYSWNWTKFYIKMKKRV